MLSLSVLFLMEQGCGGAWSSGKSPATLKIKEMVAITKLMRIMIIHVYIYNIYIYIYIYIYILYIYIYLYTFFYLSNY